MGAVIMEIFEKATAQHGFLPMCVELCVRLNSHFEKQPIEGADFRKLLVRKLLAGKILLAVSEELLSIGDGTSIEAAATLLTVAGPAFDRKSWVFLPRLHAIFSMLRCMSKDKAIPMRVRCILKDLIDLGEAGWQKK